MLILLYHQLHALMELILQITEILVLTVRLGNSVRMFKLLRATPVLQDSTQAKIKWNVHHVPPAITATPEVIPPFHVSLESSVSAQPLLVQHVQRDTSVLMLIRNLFYVPKGNILWLGRQNALIAQMEKLVY